MAGFDDSGRIWIVSKDGTKTSSWDGDDWKVSPGWMPIRAPIQVRIGEDLVTDTTSKVWQITIQDIRVFDGDIWKVYTMEDIGFKFNPETAEYDGYAMSALAEDGSGRIWIGNCDSRGEAILGQGVRWFDGITWESGDVLIGTGCVWDISTDENGGVWLGIDEVLWEASPGGEFFQNTPPEPPEGVRFFGWIEDIAFSPDDTIWPSMVACGGASCGVAQIRYKVKDGIWHQIGNPGDYFENEVFFDADGTGWFFSQGIMSRIQGNSLVSIENLEVQAATLDKDGRMWIVSNLEGKPWL